MQSSSLGMGSRLATRVLSVFLTESLREDPGAARRGRLVAGMSFGCGLTIAVGLAIRVSVAESPAWLGWGLVNFCVSIAAPFVLRFTGSLRLAGTLTTVSFFAGLLVISYQEGGLGSPVLAALPVVPLLAALMISPRAGWAAAVGVVAWCFVGGVLLDSGTELPPAFDEQQGTVLRGVAASLSALAVAFFVWFYEHERLAAERRLRAAERSAKLASRAKSQLLTNLNHDSRAPLAGVLGLSDLLLELDLPQEAWSHVRAIASSAEELRRILDQADAEGGKADEGQLDQGKLLFEIRTFSLREVVDEVIASLRPAATAKGIVLEAEVRPAVDDERQGDLHRIRQVLRNLLDNAVRSTAEGRVDLLVEPDGDGDCVRFTIHDTGDGIPPEQSALPSDPRRPAPKGHSGDIGLGLRVSRQMAELLGESIHVESSPRHGSTFRFTAALACSGRDRD